MIIKSIELSNFQVIKDFSADFEGNIYFITGDNELGKSTILKAVTALLTGERDAVLRNGEDKGFAKMIVGDDGEEYDVELRFTKSNPRGTLSIKQKTTGMRSDNVTMLQRIFGYRNFDAVKFSQWSETAEGRRKQVECVRALLHEGVRTRISEIETELQSVKEDRKAANAQAKSYKAICDVASKNLKPGDTKKYAEKIDVAELLEEQNENAKLIEKAKTVRAALETRKSQLEAIPDRIKKCEEAKESACTEAFNKTEEANQIYQETITAAKKTLAETLSKIDSHKEAAETEHKETLSKIEAEKDDFTKRKANAEAWLAKYEENNPEEANVSERLEAAEQHNEIHRLIVDYTSKKKLKDEAEKTLKVYEDKISALLKEKDQLISSSDLPISGLTFTDDGLELNGVPFMPGKVSDSQIMEVAAKLIIASNPTVKVFCIARGESLGENRLQALIDLANKEGYQGFIEEVKRGQSDLIIEEYSEA